MGLFDQSSFAKFLLQGRDAEAITAFERALELDPERLDARLKLANALARQGRLAAALPHFDAFLAELPDDAEALRKLRDDRDKMQKEINEATADVVRDFEARLARQAPLLLILDDLQWMDADSLFLLQDERVIIGISFDQGDGTASAHAANAADP